MVPKGNAGWVKSESSKTPDKQYAVTKAAVGIWICDCPAHRYQKAEPKKKHPCKHLLKIWALGRELKKLGIESGKRAGCFVADSSLY